jgi:hypothetical protein
MRHSNHSCLVIAPMLAVCALMLAGCATTPQAPVTPQQAVTPTLPPAFPPQDLVGRWGLTAYHNEADRARTVKAAANQCSNPYVITLGPTGGVMMHLADQSKPSELALKGAPGGKTYVGPQDEPPGSIQDREVVSFDGRVLILRWMDPEVQGRYGTMVYVRCAPESHKRPVKHKAKPKAKPKPTPKPAPASKHVQPPIQQINPGQ